MSFSRFLAFYIWLWPLWKQVIVYWKWKIVQQKKNAILTSKVYLFSPKILRNFSLVKAMQALLTRVSLFSFFAFTSSTTTLSISMSELWVTSSVMSTIFKLQQKLYMYYDIFLRDISISYLCERLDFTGSSTFKMYVVLGHIHGYQKSKQSITEMNKNKIFFFTWFFVCTSQIISKSV